jgi:putative holliday junction resolvase
MNRLGVDPGERRIGLAVATDDVGIALPLRTVPGGAQAVALVAEAAREVEAGEIVVGLPLRLDGSEGPSARRARGFGDAVGRRAGVPVVYWDERLTTWQAERALAEIGVRGARRKRAVDRNAAALILQSYIDARRNEGDGDRWPKVGRDDDPGAGDADRSRSGGR